jgi:hypothetical protein
VAAEVYAQQYYDDTELRAQLIARATAGDTWTPIYAALAELLLSHPDAATAELLRERSRGLRMDFATFFKIGSAIGHPNDLIEAIFDDALKPPNADEIAHHLPRWVPTVVRRLEQDQTARTAFVAALCQGDQPTRLCSLFGLLRRATGGDNALRDLARQKLAHFSNTPAPIVGFDIISGVHIPLLPLLNEIASS